MEELTMKKWENAEIAVVEIKETAHQTRLSWELDGGYIGDGIISGWFGPDPEPNPNPNPGNSENPGNDNPGESSDPETRLS